jgi:hypothetical protein
MPYSAIIIIITFIEPLLYYYAALMRYALLTVEDVTDIHS